MNGSPKTHNLVNPDPSQGDDGRTVLQRHALNVECSTFYCDMVAMGKALLEVYNHPGIAGGFLMMADDLRDRMQDGPKLGDAYLRHRAAIRAQLEADAEEYLDSARTRSRPPRA